MNKIAELFLKKRLLHIAMICILFSCASKTRIISTSDPETVSLERGGYTINASAIKKDSLHYNMFEVVVTETGGFPLSINWNKSRWFINGQNGGKFIFPGIDPDAVREDKVQDTLVDPGQTRTIEIAPFKLIAWEPLRYRRISGREKALSTGMLPQGDHEINLVLEQNEKVVQEKLKIRILHEPVQ